MSELSGDPLRLVAFVIAVATIIPATGLILRHLLTLRDPSATRRARVLDVVWTVVPLVALIGLLVAAGLA